MVALWFARLLRDGFAPTAMGRYAEFTDVAAIALQPMAAGPYR